MSYLAIRDEAVGQIQAGFAENPEIHVAAHPGYFTEKTIQQAAQKTPAILTSLVKAADGERNTITFVSWVLYRANSADKLYDGALKIVSALIPVIRKADFDLAIKDTNIEAECLYSGALDAVNITLWAVKRELILGGHALPERGSLEGLENFDEVRGTAITVPAVYDVWGG
jgi:phage gp37-like protein